MKQSTFVTPPKGNRGPAVNLNFVHSVRQSVYTKGDDVHFVITFDMGNGDFQSWKFDTEAARDAEWQSLTQYLSEI